jgi:transcription antitermination factor NusG
MLLKLEAVTMSGGQGFVTDGSDVKNVSARRMAKRCPVRNGMEASNQLEEYGLLDSSLQDSFLLDCVAAIEELFPIEVGHEYCYCMQVRATSQHVITLEAPKFFPCKAINPILIKRKWTKDGFKEAKYSLMLGYVLLFSAERMEPSYFRSLDGVYKILQYADGAYALNDGDERLARWLLKYDGTIGISKAIRVGDTVQVIEGPLRDYLGKIQKIEWRRRRTYITFDFSGISWSSWLDLDWVE